MSIFSDYFKGCFQCLRVMWSIEAISERWKSQPPLLNLSSPTCGPGQARLFSYLFPLKGEGISSQEGAGNSCCPNVRSEQRNCGQRQVRNSWGPGRTWKHGATASPGSGLGSRCEGQEWASLHLKPRSGQPSLAGDKQLRNSCCRQLWGWCPLGWGQQGSYGHHLCHTGTPNHREGQKAGLGGEGARVQVSHRTNGEWDGSPGGQIDTNKILTPNEPATLNLKVKWNTETWIYSK